MEGISAHVDYNATLALLKCKTSKKQPLEECAEDEGGCSQHDNNDNRMMCKPCVLDPKESRRLNCILAGSIRAPHRLKRANLMKTDKCNNPDCAGARANTTHICWDCGKYKLQRQKYLDAIEAKNIFSKNMISLLSNQ